ncbi:MAG: ABC transporter ATP-binding protein [Verrucomicrobiales bacterium]
MKPEPKTTTDRAAATAPGERPENFFQVENVFRDIGAQQVLRGVSLDVRRSETMVIIGASGEGKSVLLKHLTGLMQPDSGEIHVDGVEISRLSERALGPTRRKVGILFQDGALFDSMTVGQNVAFPLFEGGLVNSEEVEARVRKALAVVELEAHIEKMPIELSGGMRKRVALARAVVSNPRSILYDEPTSGLDPVVADSINRLIRRLQSEFRVTSVVVTHDMTSAYHIADRIAYLRQGRIYFLGTPEQLRAASDPAILNFVEGRSRPPVEKGGEQPL